MQTALHERIALFHQKEPGHEGPALRLQLFRKKLLLNAALLAALAHALETDGAVHQSKQGVIAALANVLTRHDVGATLTNQDVAGQNELTVCTLGAQTLCCGIAWMARKSSLSNQPAGSKPQRSSSV